MQVSGGLTVTRPNPTWVYHFTRVEHLATIRTHGLCCDRRAKNDGMLSLEVGNKEIKSRRAGRRVPVMPGGVVADYTPFYFAPRSPMMFSIHKGNVQGYDGGADRLIYLATTVERLVALGLDVVLTDRNAVLEYASFARLSDGEPDASFIDWALMEQRMWNNTEDKPDRMERRMAECLVHESVPWEGFQAVVAKSRSVADEVADLLGAERRPDLAVRRDWYF